MRREKDGLVSTVEFTSDCNGIKCIGVLYRDFCGVLCGKVASGSKRRIRCGADPSSCAAAYGGRVFSAGAFGAAQTIWGVDA